MDNYKDKYDNIILKLLELFEQEKLLDNVDEEIRKNLENRITCNGELEKLKDKIYDMKYNVVSLKSSKCKSKAILFSLIISVFVFYLLIIGLVSSIIWLLLLYLIPNIIVHYNLYLKKVNDRDFMLGDLEQSLDYISLIEQLDCKNRELNILNEDYERLSSEYEELYLKTEYMYTMLYGFVLNNDIENGIVETMESDLKNEIDYAIDKGLVRKRVRNIYKKRDE